ncbi:MAG: TonB C-terminal domain-containing protein [Candidatus Obscuribacterales bacterium]|nr:TonB C-terminal domain-containing protein [Candidatus Obscuribacterales bacterium]
MKRNFIRVGMLLSFSFLSSSCLFPQSVDAAKTAVRAVADVDFGPFMARMQKRVKQAWSPPRKLEAKEACVLYKIHQDGSLSDLKLERSSGSKLADSAALKAVQDAAPFESLPPGSPSVVDFRFRFDYNGLKTNVSSGAGILNQAPASNKQSQNSVSKK